MAEPKLDINKCSLALAEARKAFDAVKERSDSINREMTTATNALNKAQQDFDEAAAQLRRDAPWGTDWARPRAIGTAA